MVTLALTFTVRGDILEDLSRQFQLNKEQLGLISGAAFWGFVLAIFTGGQLCDVLGMGRLMSLAFVGHMVGTLSIILAGGFWPLWVGTLILGLANGFVEGAINPLISSVLSGAENREAQRLACLVPGRHSARGRRGVWNDGNGL